MTAEDERAARLRRIPAVTRLLDHPVVAPLAAAWGHALVVRAAGVVTARLRVALEPDGADVDALTDLDRVAAAVAAAAADLARPALRRVVNATGVVVHTNLGRSVLAPPAVAAAVAAASGYSNLELDLATGRRGSRYDHLVDIVREVTGAEAALVVNNNAAAVFLALAALAASREVVVSRGQLVEIGGSFRIPDVMAASGAHLMEVGTTNKTRLADYERAIGPDTAMLFRAHQSNFRQVGFTAQVELADLVRLGHQRGLLVVEDLGSGMLVDLGLEPTVQASVATGVDVVCFSGDKLLGGPQAGILAGRAGVIQVIRQHPLVRALRVGKLTIAALAATLQLYRDPAVARRDVPTVAMLSRDPADLDRAARQLASQLTAALGPTATVTVVDGSSRAGGGSLPEKHLRTRLVAVTVAGVAEGDLSARLRRHDPPVLARVSGARLLLDPRTLLPGDEAVVVAALATAVRGEEVTGP